MIKDKKLVFIGLGALLCNALTVAGIGSTTSCWGKCGTSHDRNRPCQCNDNCSQFNDCCSDYTRICGAISGQTTPSTTISPTTRCWDRCDIAFDKNLQCQCNKQCQQYNNCCQDYVTFCTTSQAVTTPQTVTDGEIAQLAALLESVDTNAPSSNDFTLDPQSYISSIDDRKDTSPNRLISYVNEGALFSKPTYATFISLLDNYNPLYGKLESSTSSENNEEQRFITAIMNTQVMQKLWTFLKNKGYSSSSSVDFENQLKQLWFKKYSRKYGVTDSSGFEHVYVGEINTGTDLVSGFHNWIQFYLQEKTGKANYAGYYEYKPHKITMKFTWLNKWKPIGGFFIGTSPEWEMAVNTACFLLRPNAKCHFQLDGRTVEITSYDYHGQADLIATTYPTH